MVTVDLSTQDTAANTAALLLMLVHSYVVADISFIHPLQTVVAAAGRCQGARSHELPGVLTAPPPPASPAAWQCVDGILGTLPIRWNNNGDIECMSKDAIGCMWKNSTSDCNALASEPPSKLQPLVCGAMHSAMHGEPGYSKPDHWCTKGRRVFAAATVGVLTTSLLPPSAWRCVAGVRDVVPVRLNKEGDIECMAENGQDCMWRPDFRMCNALASAPLGNLQPLACGRMHEVVKGGTGYTDPDHWCYRGRQAMSTPMALPSPPVTPWRCADDILTPFRLNKNNDVECMSQDARWCMGQESVGDCNALAASPPRNVRSLACGSMHLAVWGSTGYDQPDSWCVRGRRVFATTPPPSIPPGAGDITGATCEMQCSDPNAPDVSCGGTFSSHTVYVLKGKQGECRVCLGQPSC
jgi:hypothetical protein